jgi:hypothetical protein
MRIRRFLSCLAAFALVLTILGGCGLFDSNDDKPEASKDEQQDDSALTGDEKLAQSALLTIDSFPDGWSESEYSSAVIAAAIEGTLPECRDAQLANVFEETSSASAGLEQFSLPSRDRVDASVWVFEDEPAATSALKRLSSLSGLLTTCHKAVLEARRDTFGFAPDAEIEVVVDTDSGLGDESVTVTGRVAGSDFDTYQSVVVRVGRILVSVTSVAIDPNLDMQPFVDAAVERAQNALS